MFWSHILLCLYLMFYLLGFIKINFRVIKHFRFLYSQKSLNQFDEALQVSLFWAYSFYSIHFTYSLFLRILTTSYISKWSIYSSLYLWIKFLPSIFPLIRSSVLDEPFCVLLFCSFYKLGISFPLQQFIVNFFLPSFFSGTHGSFYLSHYR